MVLSTTAAGTISQTARGLLSFLTNSASDAVPTAFSFASSATALGDMSNTTHHGRPCSRRRTMLRPSVPDRSFPVAWTPLLGFEEAAAGRRHLRISTNSR